MRDQDTPQRGVFRFFVFIESLGCEVANSQSGVYTKTIQSLASLSEGTSLVQLVKTIEAEAKTAGATKIVIEGIEIVNKKILTVNPKAAAKLGYTLERTSKTSIKLVKQL